MDVSLPILVDEGMPGVSSAHLDGGLDLELLSKMVYNLSLTFRAILAPLLRWILALHNASSLLFVEQDLVAGNIPHAARAELLTQNRKGRVSTRPSIFLLETLI